MMQLIVNCSKKLNSDSLKKYSSIFDSVKNKRVFGIAEFNSKLCYALLHHSRSPHQGNEFIFDNLGYSNVLLMIRGGKTIFKTQSSRHFRLLMPVDEELFQLMISGKNHSYTRVGDMVLTPWMS